MSLAAEQSGAPRQLPMGRLLVYGAVGLIGLALLFAPFLFPDVRSQEVAARICVFIVLAASFDLLIGYTGIVSFAHTMFFGLGAYGTAIALKQFGASFTSIVLGGGAGVFVALVLAVLIGLLSLRVKAIFFAMVTLAAASVMRGIDHHAIQPCGESGPPVKSQQFCRQRGADILSEILGFGAGPGHAERQAKNAIIMTRQQRCKSRRIAFGGGLGLPFILGIFAHHVHETSPPRLSLAQMRNKLLSSRVCHGFARRDTKIRQI